MTTITETLTFNCGNGLQMRALPMEDNAEMPHTPLEENHLPSEYDDWTSPKSPFHRSYPPSVESSPSPRTSPMEGVKTQLKDDRPSSEHSMSSPSSPWEFLPMQLQEPSSPCQQFPSPCHTTQMASEDMLLEHPATSRDWAAHQPHSQQHETSDGSFEAGNDISSPLRSTSGSSPITAPSSSPKKPHLDPPVQLSASTLSSSDFADFNSDEMIEHLSRPRTPTRHGLRVADNWSDGLNGGRRALERHQQSTLPHVLNACKALQAVMDMRNEASFMPTPPAQAVVNPVATNPGLKHLRGWGPLSIKLRDGMDVDPADIPDVMCRVENRQNGGGGVLLRQKGKPKLTLRETLVMHGQQPYGRQSRTELRSLTFHDLTPDMRSGHFKNEVLLHFDAGHGTKLVAYEVDV